MHPRIERNHSTGLYSTEYAGITYIFPFELNTSILNYYRAQRGSVADWYRDLPGEDRKKVKLEGVTPEKGDFYPDSPAD